jgi:hypothetical protein
VYVPSPPRRPTRLAHIMGNRQEFYVRFKGPEESQSLLCFRQEDAVNTLQRRSKEASGRFTSNSLTSTHTNHQVLASSIESFILISTSCTSTSELQVESNRALQVRLRLPRRDQPNLVTDVRHDQYIRGLPAPTPPLSQSYRPIKW